MDTVKCGTMFEGAIAAFLNRLLGKYVEDLDTEQFNVGIFSGDTCLTDLKLKPEALVSETSLLRTKMCLLTIFAFAVPARATHQSGSRAYREDRFKDTMVRIILPTHRTLYRGRNAVISKQHVAKD